MTLLCALAIHPLLLLDPQFGDSIEEKLLVACLLIMAMIGTVLGCFYTLYLWYAALRGLYEVDTFSSMLIKENPRQKL